MGKQEERSELLIVAQALESALQRFHALADSLGKQKLDSGSAVERAGRLLAEAAECEGRINQSVATLSAAFQTLRQRQERQVQRIQQQTDVIQERSEEYRRLVTQYEALGRAAQELNERIRPMLSGAEGANVAGAMIEIEAGGTDLAAKAQRLVAQASEQGFADVVRLAEALRQQLHAALNKLKLSAAKLARA